MAELVAIWLSSVALVVSIYCAVQLRKEKKENSTSEVEKRADDDENKEKKE